MENPNCPQCAEALAALENLKQARAHFYEVLYRQSMTSGPKLCTRFDIAYNNLVDVIADLGAAYIRAERIVF